MQFVVSRTSSSNTSTPPCEGAEKRLTKIKSVRGNFPDYDYIEWVIEIKTIEELMDFSKNNGEVIVNWSSKEPTIEIYDDWCE